EQVQLQHEIEQHKQTTREFTQIRAELVQHVQQRTADLLQAVEKLKQEINEHQPTEAALRRSEARFHQMAAITGRWIWELDAQGCYSYCSPGVQDSLGYAPQEMIGKHFSEF